MAATNWTIIKRRKDNGKILLVELTAKWTYKTAVGIAQESIDNEHYDLVCVVESNKIMLNDEKIQENNDTVYNTK